MKIPIYQIDTFTDKVFGGNPAAVCPLEQWLPSDLMQKIAAENNLSETAFFVKKDYGYAIRWFTPTQEVDLCGHATLAAGFVIYNFLGFALNEITFDSQSGPLKVIKKGEDLFLDFPSRKPEPINDFPEALIRGLGQKPTEVLISRDYLVIYSSREEIKNLKPDFKILAEVKNCLGIIVSAPGQREKDDCDFVSRFFAPNAGVDEDPVTGSAHCILIPYWSKRLNKKHLLAKQVSQRGGNLVCEDSGERVFIGGQCVCFLRGEIEV